MSSFNLKATLLTGMVALKLSFMEWFRFQWALTKNMARLSQVLQLEEPRELRRVLIHHIKFLAAIAVLTKVLKLVSFGKISDDTGTPFTLQIISAFLGVIPIAAIYYSANALFPRVKVSFIAWLTAIYALYNNLLVSIVPFIIPFAAAMFLLPEHGDRWLPPLLFWFIGCVIILVTILVQVNARGLLQMSRREYVAYLLVTLYLWLPVVVMALYKKHLLTAIQKRIGVSEQTIDTFFRNLDDLIF